MPVTMNQHANPQSPQAADPYPGVDAFDPAGPPNGEGGGVKPPSGSLARTVGVAAYTLVAALGLVLVLAGSGRFGVTPSDTLMLAGCAGLFLTLTLAPLALFLEGFRRQDSSRQLTLELQRLNAAVARLTEQAALSDDARRVLNRQAERALLCRTIEEDIRVQDWDAALVLCTELADHFGYRAEAEQFRARVESARSAVQDRRITDAIAHLDGLIVQRRWDNALSEAARIGRLFPEAHRVEGLRTRVEQARTVYKADLERRFLEAARNSRVEEAMELLKELDAYLTTAEGEPYREMARGVIGKARDNLGAQFKIAVQDHQWASAAAVGRRIINEFPNTRMAVEVRGLMDGILARANS